MLIHNDKTRQTKSFLFYSYGNQPPLMDVFLPPQAQIDPLCLKFHSWGQQEFRFCCSGQWSSCVAKT